MGRVSETVGPWQAFSSRAGSYPGFRSATGFGGEVSLKGRLSTVDRPVDLLVITSLDQLIFILSIIFLLLQNKPP